MLSWDQRRIPSFSIAPSTALHVLISPVIELGPAYQWPPPPRWERAARNRSFSLVFYAHPKARLCPVCRQPTWDAARRVSSLLPRESTAKPEAGCGRAAPVALPGFGDIILSRHRLLPVLFPSAKLPVQVSASVLLLRSPSCATSAAYRPPPGLETLLC